MASLDSVSLAILLGSLLVLAGILSSLIALRFGAPLLLVFLLLGMLAGEGARERADKAHPLGRIGRPEDIAAAAVWLCSDEASWITGQALVVDGGLSAQSHLTGMSDPRPAHLRPGA